MFRYFLAALILAQLVLPLHADSIDDAEAKRRGIPVAQAAAERQLAAEKARGATLEKQLADLKKQLAELQAISGVSATPDTPPAAARGTPATPVGAARGTAATPKPGTATATQNRDGTQSYTVTPAGGGRSITFTGTFDELGVMRPATQPSKPKP